MEHERRNARLCELSSQCGKQRPVLGADLDGGVCADLDRGEPVARSVEHGRVGFEFEGDRDRDGGQWLFLLLGSEVYFSVMRKRSASVVRYAFAVA